MPKKGAGADPKKSAPAPAKKPRLQLLILASEKRKDLKMLRCIEAFFLLKFRFLKCFVSNLFFGAGAGGSQAFMKKKISGDGAEEKWFGSATMLDFNKF